MARGQSAPTRRGRVGPEVPLSRGVRWGRALRRPMSRKANVSNIRPERSKSSRRTPVTGRCCGLVSARETSDVAIETGVAEDITDGRPTAASKRRRDRELIELLTELRVALPGVQVLFAFLLTVPFTARFAQLGRVNRDAYFVAFISSAAASAFLIAPSAYHRLRWRQGDKERMLRVSNQLAIAGIAALAIGITAVVYLITALLYGTLPAVGGAIVMAGTIAGLWFFLPFQHRGGRARDISTRARDGRRGA
jgi:Family of unknown function (DUF6328)